jgi:hypothetical protein
MEQTAKTIVCLVVFCAVGSIDVFGKPFAVGPYLGQIPPGPIAQVFAPGLICDTRPFQWEHGHSSGNHMGISLQMVTHFVLTGLGMFISQKTRTRAGQRLSV